MSLFWCAVFGHNWSPWDFRKMRASGGRRMARGFRWCTRCPRAETHFIPLGERR